MVIALAMGLAYAVMLYGYLGAVNYLAVNLVILIFGYAGWGPDQLEREIELRAWGIAEADPTLIFDEDRDKVWDHAWERRTQHF